MVWVWLCLGLIILFVILLFSSVYVICHFTYAKERQVLFIRIKLYHISIFKKEIDLSEEEGSILNIWKGKSLLEGLYDLQNTCREMIRDIQKLKSIVSLFLQRVKIHEFVWHTHIGTGDAGTAGIAAGSVWTIKGMITGVIANKSNLCCTPDTTVNPHFQYKCLQSTLDCMVSVKIGQAIGVFSQMPWMHKEAME